MQILRYGWPAVASGKEIYMVVRKRWRMGGEQFQGCGSWRAWWYQRTLWWRNDILPGWCVSVL